MKKRIGLLGLGLALLLVMVLVLLPSLQTKADAAMADSITIGTTILQSGQYLPRGASYVVNTKPDGGYAYYNNGVLTLDGFSYWERSGNDAIHADGDLTITLIGTNGIYIDENFTSSGNCIDVAGNLTINGSGPLTLSSRSYNAITVSGNLNFNQTGKVTVTTNYGAAVYCNGAVTINGNLSATSVANGMGIFSKNTLTMNSGTVSVSADAPGTYAAIKSSAGGVVINGGNLTVTSTYHGIETLNAFSQRGGTVTVNSTAGTGILVNNATSNAVIYAGTLSVTGNRYGIQAQRFYTYGGHGFIYSDNTAHDSTYCAVKVTDGYVKASHITAKASTNASGINQTDIVASNLGTYDFIHFYANIQLSGYTVSDGMYFQFANASVSSTKPTSGGYAYYKDNTLTLHNHTGVANANGVIHNYDLTIVLDAGTTNSITTSTSDSSCEGIYVQGALTIKGSGSLTLYQGGYAVYSTGNLTVNSATLDCRNSGLYAGGNMTLTNAKITVGQMSTMTAKKHVIHAAGSISISGSNTQITVNSPNAVYYNGNYVAALALYGKGISISNGNLVLTCTEGIESSADFTITGGRVTVSAGTGVVAKNITVSNGYLDAIGTTNGISATKLTVNSGNVYAYSKNTQYDSTYSAIKVASPYSSNFVVASNLAVIGNYDATPENSAAIDVNELTDYDYIRIGNFVMLHDVVLPSGYYMESGNSVKIVSQTAPSSGKYAYYSNGVLTLNNYSYSGSSVAIRTYTDTRINLVGGSEVNHIISHAGNLVFVGSALHLKANLGTAAINTNGDIFIDGGKITVDSGYAGIYCENFYLRGGWVWVTASYHGINFNSKFTVSSGAITIKSTNTSGDSSYRAINSRVSSPTISVTGNHMAGRTAEPDILTTTAYTSSDIDFVALGECIMVRGVILYKGCYLFNGDAQPYQNVGSHTEYAYLKDQNTLELKGYQYSGSAYGIASNIDLTIVVCGDENSIEAKGGCAAITVRGNLTIVDGTNYSDELTLKAVSGYAIYVTEDYVHTDVRLNASSSNYYPVYVNGDFTFNSGNFDTTSTYTGTTHNYPALTVNGNATFTKGFLNATAAPNYGDAMEITGNANFNGATVTVTSPKGNGINVKKGYLGVRGSKLTVTAEQNGIYLAVGRLNMSDGFLTVSSTNTTSDGTYAALKLAGTSSDYYNVSSSLLQSASVDGTGVSLKTLTPANLSTYDFVIIGDYIMVAGKRVPSGYSISSTGTVTKGDKGAGYAYYSNGKLTLNGFNCTATSSTSGIEATLDLTISVTGASTISTEGGYAIYAMNNLTLSNNYALTITTESTAAINVLGNLFIVGPTLTVNAPGATGIYADGTLTISQGTVTVTAKENGIVAGNMTVSGGELRIEGEDNGVRIENGQFSMYGGYGVFISSSTGTDSNRSAIRLFAETTTYYAVPEDMAQAASLSSTWNVSIALEVADLHEYDYVVIGDFVEIGGVVVRSGYSINADGTVFKGNKGAGYAYYYNSTLILDSFTYIGECDGICAYKDLTLQLKNTNALTVPSSVVGIDALANLTISGTGNLNVTVEDSIYVSPAVRIANNFYMQGGTVRMKGSYGMRMDNNNSQIIMDGGTLTLDGYGYLAAADMTVNGGYISITEGLGIDSLTVNGGTLMAEGATYGIVAKSATFNGGTTIAKGRDNFALRRESFTLGENMVVWVSSSLDGTNLRVDNNPASDAKYVRITTCNHVDVTTDKDHNCDICGKEEITRPNAVKTEYDDTYHWSVCDCGEKMAGTGEEHTFVDGTCVCGKDIRGFTKQPVGGEVAYGQKLTVTWTINFNPAMLVVVHYHGEDMTFQDLATSATSAELAPLPEGDYYTIRALIDTDGLYIESNKIYVTERKGPAPVISVPQSMTVTQGDILDLYCSATSPDGSQLSYLWYSTSTGKLEDIIAVNRGAETNDTLRVDTTYPGTYYYVCGVDTANGGSTYSSIITVTVVERGFTQQPTSGTVSSSGTYTATWQTNFTPVRLVLQTFENGQYTFKELDINATSYEGQPLAEGGYHVLYAYYSEEGCVLSEIFSISAGEPGVTSITVNCVGTISYTISGNVVTVTHDIACKVGYRSGDAYVAIKPTVNSDGSYSFAAPDGVTEVLLVVKGDVNGDGKVNISDKSRLNAVLLNKTSLTAEAGFAADVTGDGKVNTSDKSRLNAVLLNKTTLTW